MPSRFTKRNTTIPLAKLQLTSLIDMFTILLVFLLMNYSVTTISIAPDKDLTLPFTQSENIADKMAVRLVVSQSQIAVEGEKILSVSDGRVATDEVKDNEILKLSEALRKIRDRSEFVSQLNPDAQFQGTIILQADRRTSYELLNEIMYTAGKLGYLSFVLAGYKRQPAEN